MKLSNLILLTLAIAYTYQATCCSECTQRLKSDPDADTESSEATLPTVEVFTESKTDGFVETGFCGAVFKEHGACCNQEQLHARAKAWRKRLNLRYRRLKQGISKFLISVKKAEKLKAFVTKNADKIKKANKPPKPADKRVRVKGKTTGNTNRRILETNSAQDVIDMEEALDKAAKRSEAERDSIQLKSEAKWGLCFKVMMQNRYKGLCLRCSGVASSIYESATGSYKFKQNFCANTIKECAPVYALMAESQKFYMQMIKLRLALGKKIKGTVVVSEPSSTQVDAWIACAKDVDACVADAEKVKELCQDFSISTTNPQLGEDPNVAEDGNATVDDNSAELRRLLLANGSNLRLLQTGTDGPGYVKVDSTSSIDLAVVQSGDDDTGYDSSSLLLKSASVLVAISTLLML